MRKIVLAFSLLTIATAAPATYAHASTEQDNVAAPEGGRKLHVSADGKTYCFDPGDDC